jgi:hypothetical protein
MSGQKTYTKQDYHDAINFCLNYPTEFDYYYNLTKDIYTCNVLVDGWHTLKLEGGFVRTALKYEGKRQWTADAPSPKTDDYYAEVFK